MRKIIATLKRTLGSRIYRLYRHVVYSFLFSFLVFWGGLDENLVTVDFVFGYSTGHRTHEEWAGRGWVVNGIRSMLFYSVVLIV